MRATAQRARASKTQAYPAPTRGWVQSGNITSAKLDGAEILENFLPTSQGARIRGGAAQVALLADAVVELLAYASGATEKLFGATDTGIADVTRIQLGGANFYDVAGLTSGDMSYAQFSTSGGQFVMCVNGADDALYFDGSAWNPINAAAVENLGYDALTAAFSIGDTVTGGTSAATATVVGITQTSATEGTLKLGGVSGTFSDDEAITSAGGSATANGANTSSSAVAITGVDTSDLSHVWLFKERLFFIEKDTLSAWYLPVEQIGGAASEINLGPILRRGGKLLFGATWSLDSGNGLDDVCLFVTDQGEIAVFAGSDPSTASDWALSGVYEIGKPLNKRAHFKAGGDLVILTKDGVIPVSEAVRKDRAALRASAVSEDIEDAWIEAIANATSNYPISCTHWQSQTLLIIGTPLTIQNRNIAFAANSRTGAWCRISGWDVRCSEIFGDEFYFGTESGAIFKGDTGGQDGDLAYSATYVGKYETYDNIQMANAVGITYRATAERPARLVCFGDYDTSSIAAPDPIFETESAAVWGTMVWGDFQWGVGAAETVFTTWESAYAEGYSIAPGVAVVSNQPAKPVFEILSMRVRMEEGYPL